MNVSNIYQVYLPKFIFFIDEVVVNVKLLTDNNYVEVLKDMMSQIGASLEELEPTVSEEKESSEEMPHAGVQSPHTIKISRPCTPQLNKSTPQSLPSAPAAAFDIPQKFNNM